MKKGQKVKRFAGTQPEPVWLLALVAPDLGPRDLFWPLLVPALARLGEGLFWGSSSRLGLISGQTFCPFCRVGLNSGTMNLPTPSP